MEYIAVLDELVKDQDRDFRRGLLSVLAGKRAFEEVDQLRGTADYNGESGAGVLGEEA